MDSLQSYWRRLGSTQRMLAFGLVMSLVAAGAFLYWTSRPQFVPLTSGLQAKDAADVTGKLKELKIAYNLAGDGTTILVNKDEVFAARLALAQADLPRGGSVGMELFDQTHWGATDFERRVQYNRALQGELERAISRLGPVDYANVKLALPDDSVFAKDRRPTTAAVLVRLRSGGALTPEQVRGIISFVARSVEGLKPDDVTVMDDRGVLLTADTAAAGSSGALAGPQLLQQESVQKDLEKRVQSLLEPAFGAGNVVARVHVRLDNEAKQTESRTVIPVKGNQGVLKSSQVTQEVGGSTGPSQGTPATAANKSGPVTYTSPGQGNSNYTKSNLNNNYDVSERKETVSTLPGGIKDVTVGVLVNRADIPPDLMDQVRNTVAAAVGAQLAGVTVTPLRFNREALVPPTPDTKPVVVAPSLSPLAMGVAIALAVAGALGFLLMRGRAEPVAALAGPGTPEAAMFQPRLVPGAPALFQQPVAAAAHTAVAEPGFREEEELELSDLAIPNKLKERIDGLIETDPEAAAQLLRTWMAS